MHLDVKKAITRFHDDMVEKRSSLISTKLAENNFSFVGQNAYSCSFSCYFACAKKVFSRASNSAQNLLLSRKHDVPERHFQTVLCQCFTIDVLHVNFGLLSYRFYPKPVGCLQKPNRLGPESETRETKIHMQNIYCE